MESFDMYRFSCETTTLSITSKLERILLYFSVRHVSTLISQPAPWQSWTAKVSRNAHSAWMRSGLFTEYLCHLLTTLDTASTGVRALSGASMNHRTAFGAIEIIVFHAQ